MSEEAPTWGQTHYQMTLEVQKRFAVAVAGHRAPPPSRNACSSIATWLMTIRETRAAKNPSYPAASTSNGYQAKLIEFKALERHWSRLQRALSGAITAKIERDGNDWQKLGPALVLAQHQIESVLQCFDPGPDDAIRFAAERIREIWQADVEMRKTCGENIGDAPRSEAAGAPLCKAIVQLLNLINMNTSAALASEVLRGRRHR